MAHGRQELALGDLLFVVGPVGFGDDGEAVPFVEAAGAQVLLQGPQAEFRRGLPRLLQQPDPEADVLGLGLDEQVLDEVGTEGDITHRPLPVVGQPDLVGREQPLAEPPLVLGRRM